MRQFLFGLSAAALAWWLWSPSNIEANSPAGSPAAGAANGGSASRGQDPQSGDQVPDFGAMLRGSVPATSSAPAGARPTGANGAALRVDAGNSGPNAKVAAANPVPEGQGPAGQDPAAKGRDANVQAAFEQLVARIKTGDEAARGQALRVLGMAQLWPEHRDQLRTLLGLPTDGGGQAATSALGAQIAGDTMGTAEVDKALAALGSGNGFLHSVDGRRLGKRVLELLANLDDAAATQAGTALLERCMQGDLSNGDREALEFVNAAYEVYRVRADRHLCDPANLAKAHSYTVKRGDSLGAIAGRYRRQGIAVDEGSLAVLNRIHNPNAIQIGQRIKVPVEPIRAVLEKRSFMLAVYVGERILRTYRVGHGENGKTPVTTFTVMEKLKDPDWYAPDGRVIASGNPENILGSYFIKFKNDSYTGFGAHGTPMPETIGTESSMGCIRMYDADIEELFKLLPRGAEVEVRDSH